MSNPSLKRFFYHPDSGWSHDQLQPGSNLPMTKGGREISDLGLDVIVRSIPQGLSLRFPCSDLTLG